MTTLRRKLPSTSSDHMPISKSSLSRTSFLEEKSIRSTNWRRSRRLRFFPPELANTTNSRLKPRISMDSTVSSSEVARLCNLQERYTMRTSKPSSRKVWTKVCPRPRWEQRLLSFIWKIRMRTKKPLKEGRNSWILIRKSWTKTSGRSRRWLRIWDWIQFSRQETIMMSQMSRNRLVFRKTLGPKRCIRRLRKGFTNSAKDRLIRVKVSLDRKSTWETNPYKISKTSSVMAKCKNTKFLQLCYLKVEFQDCIWRKSNKQFTPRVIVSTGKLRKMEAVWPPLQQAKPEEENKTSNFNTTKILRKSTPRILRKTKVKLWDLTQLHLDQFWCPVATAKKCSKLLRILLNNKKPSSDRVSISHKLQIP